jgi:acetoin utilization deacetylase AcuC-like enzyme
MMNELVFFYPQGHEAHQEPGHPERPQRIEVIRRSLEEVGWWDIFPHLLPKSLSDKFIASIHTEEYLKLLEASCERGAHLDVDTYTTPESWQLALNAAGGAVEIACAVWGGDSQRGIALTRPPGHHATPNRGMGFCLLNNIALAAEYLLNQSLEYVANPQRIAIIDLDLHHGNGTQDIFWRRDDVLYISTHQSPLYPGTGHLEETGSGPGEGCTANFPLPPGTGDIGFISFMQELILPLLDQFRPEILLTSVGFDPHWRDPLGHLLLSASGYGDLIAALTSWADDHCDGKLALFLEGGYDLDAGAACIQSWVAALMGSAWQDRLGVSPREEGDSWKDVRRRALEIWKL